MDNPKKLLAILAASVATAHADLAAWKSAEKRAVAPDQNRFQRRAPRPCANTRDCRKKASA